MKIIEGRACAEFKGKCKFCQKELTLYIDASYDGLRDPMGLIQMAACDRCGDYRAERSDAEQAISLTCVSISRIRKQVKNDKPTEKQETLLSGFKKALSVQTQKYARSLCAYLRASRLFWSEQLVDDIYDNPDNWPNILKRYRMETFTEIRKELHE